MGLNTFLTVLDLILDFSNERKKSFSSVFTSVNSSVSSRSSAFPEGTARVLKNTRVDFIFVDAADKHDRMPLDTVDVDAMKMKGTYVSREKFTNEEQFVAFIESNAVFGASLSQNFYLYTVARQYAVKLKPTSFHKRNFPSESSMVAICQTRFLVISPNPKDKEEKKAFFSSTRLNGITSIDLEDLSSEDKCSHKDTMERSLEKKSLKYESSDDAAVQHSSLKIDPDNFIHRKRSFHDKSDSEEILHGAKSYKLSPYSSETRDRGIPDSGCTGSSSKSNKFFD